jgi:hypothetical protein
MQLRLHCLNEERESEMSFQRTMFPYFYDECTKCFGKVQGQQIYKTASEKLDKMKKQADYRKSRAIKKHMDGNMLPIIAIYLTYKESGLTQEEAYKNTLEISQIAAMREKIKNIFLSKLPYGYSLFKLFCKHVMIKDYPNAGWDVAWRRYDNEEIHFDMKSCIYAETTKKYDCPELCTVFCSNDTTAFSGYRPSVLFERRGTIAEGQKVCDFHFKNGKRTK